MAVKTHRNCNSGCMNKWRDRVNHVDEHAEITDIKEDINIAPIRGIAARKTSEKDEVRLTKGMFNGQNLAEYYSKKTGPKPTYVIKNGILIRRGADYNAPTPYMDKNGNIIIPLDKNIPTSVRIKKKNFLFSTNIEKFHHRGVGALTVRKKHLQHIVVLQNPAHRGSFTRSLLLIPSTGQPITNSQVKKNIYSLI